MRLRRVSGDGLLLVPAAALVVHQLRYALGYGPGAGVALSTQGHAYQHSLVPWVVLALGAGFSAFLRRVARARRTGEPGLAARLSPAALWAVTAAGLLAIYTVQETLEGTFATGHPGGIAGVFGHGGWWAVPASAVVAAGVVALVGVGRAVLRLAGARPAPRLRSLVLAGSAPRGATLLRPAPLARSAAGRAPPVPVGG